MPIKDKSLYPDNWRELSHHIRFERAGGRCEWMEDGQRCEAKHGQNNPLTGSKVVLTTAHLDHDTANNLPANLMAMCQKHHLAYDAPLHAKHAKETRLKKQVDAGQLSLLEEHNER